MEWREWLAGERAKSTMSVEEISLAEVKGWGMQETGARFGRPDGKFFDLVGVRITNAGREVAVWDQPMLREVGAGAVVLFRLLDLFLVAAKAEPGNPRRGGCVMLAPSFQALVSNLEQAHGGKRPPRAEFLDDCAVKWVAFQQDGGRYFGKANRYAIVRVKIGEITLNPNERWFTRSELCDAFRAGECNEHLAQALLLAVL